MDVMDAGVYVSKWEAGVPKHTKMVLWGPLQAKEMGLDGWEVQDGGETGFVLHNPSVKLTMGRATSTLIFVRRLERAFLTIYFGGYPADAPAGQRKLDVQKIVAPCEMFLGRLSKEKVQFQFQGEMALVDNVNDASAGRRAPPGAPAKALGGGKLSKSGDIIDADEEMAKKAGYVTTTGKSKAKPAAPAADEDEAEHVDGTPSWVRVPKDAKGKAKVVDGDATPRKTGGKGKSEVWEV